MKLYAETARLRTRQVAFDLIAVAWVALWVMAGRAVARVVDALAAPGRAVQQAGNGFAAGVDGVRDKVGRIPLVGDELKAPFARLGDAGRGLAHAGVVQQDVVHQLALWLAVLVAAVPIVALLLAYLPGRWRWIREATAAARLRLDAADLGLFALRAVAGRPLRELRRVSSDPAGALAAGDYDALAALELRALGLRPDRLRGPGRDAGRMLGPGTPERRDG